MKFFFYVILFIFLLNFSYTPILFAYDQDIDPDVVTISTGPSMWGVDGGFKFRFIVVLSEVYLHIFIQKIKFGEENCCAKAVKSYEINSKKIEGKGNLFSVTNIKWLSTDSVQFKGNSETFVLYNLDGKYQLK